MKIGIMQPYFIPYIGYWQLINSVDKFIVYDDVNFIKKGWINRNNILMNTEVQQVTLPIYKASQNKLINQHLLAFGFEEKENFLKTIQFNYKKAPFYNEVLVLLKKIIYYEEQNLALFLTNSIKEICEYLDIDTEIVLSSELEKDNTLKAEEKIIHICKKLDATQYINSIGGQVLYKKENFANIGIQLSFIKTLEIKYNQFNNNVFTSNLSIIDMLMFNEVEKVKSNLDKYELI